MSDSQNTIPPKDVQRIFNEVVSDLSNYRGRNIFADAIVHNLAEVLEENSSIGWMGNDILHEGMLASHDLIESNSFPEWTLDEIMRLLDGFAIFETPTIPGRFVMDESTGNLKMAKLQAMSWQYDHAYEEYTFQFYSREQDSDSIDVPAGPFRLVASIRIPSGIVINKQSLLEYCVHNGIHIDSAGHFSSALMLLFCVFIISNSSGVGEVKEYDGPRPSKVDEPSPRNTKVHNMRKLNKEYIRISGQEERKQDEARKRGIQFQWRVRSHFRRIENKAPDARPGSKRIVYVRSHLKGQAGTPILREAKITWIWN